ncbi:MAG TPA: response regulator [Bacteroidia bacterium]|nr:response regulator [Bacteroidia bacterium]
MIINTSELSGRSIQATDKAPLKILLVDDIPANLLTLEGILEDESRILIKAFSGNEALKLLMEEPIDLILLDIQMPDMDGVEVAQLLRANPKTKHIPIIFVSAIAKSERPSLEEFETGSFDFIPKPLDIEETQKIVSIFEFGCRYKLKYREQEEKLKRLNDHLDKFLYILSHDLNAPLRAIENLVQWLEEDLQSQISDESKENIGLLRNRVAKMKLLLDGLLRYARSGNTKHHQDMISPEKMIRQIVAELQGDRKVSLNIDSSVLEMQTDRTALQLVLKELIQNAMFFNPSDKSTIDISVSEKNDSYEFVVADNGPGIKPQHQKIIFELFQTLPSSVVPSSGVGLSIVKKVVEEYGGTVWFSPTVKCGTEVHFNWKKSKI